MQLSNFEALAYAQAAAGVIFVRGRFCHPFNDDPSAKRSSSGAKSHFVKVALEIGKVEIGDELVCQVIDRNSFSILRVAEVLPGPPQSDEYDYSKPLKWAVCKVPKERSQHLFDVDRETVSRITQALLQVRTKEISAALGVDVASLLAPPTKGVSIPSTSSDALVIEEDDEDDKEEAALDEFDFDEYDFGPLSPRSPLRRD